MNIKPVFLLILVVCLSIITACNSTEVDEDDGVDQIEKVEENKEDSETEEVEMEEVKQEEKQSDNQHIENPEQEIGSYNIYLGGQLIENENYIIIEGTSNLIPESRVTGTISVGEDEYLADVTSEVKEDGTFQLEVPHHDLKKETIVKVTFDLEQDQEDIVKRHYGDRGQELLGSYIYKHQGDGGDGSPHNIYKMAKAEINFVPEENLAIRQFKEPERYPIPEDLGDPNVWIEVDEVNNDDSYLYIHGKTNLIEGSVLTGDYNRSNDKTTVEPDGSFNIKMEYEFKKEEQIVIGFDPSWYQWNIIEETYGAKGQQLTGDFVVNPNFSDRQIIQKEFDMESTDVNVPDDVDLTIDGTEVTMFLPDHLLFDFDEYELRDEAKEVLLEINETLVSFDQDIKIEISGHTDNVGDEAYNLDLSEKRATEVKNFFEKQESLTNLAFTTTGHGETIPIATNDTEAGQAKNRRVELTIDLR